MLFAQIPGGGRHDCFLSDHNLAILSQGLPDVVFAHEVGGLGDSGSFRASGG